MSGIVVAMFLGAVLGDVAALKPRGARITWARGEGAAECVGPLALAEDVKARLGWDPSARPAEIEVEGAVTRVEGAFRAELSFREPGGAALGTRRLVSKARDCKALGDAVATAITVFLAPDAPARAGARSEAPVDLAVEVSAKAPPAPERRPPEPKLRAVAWAGVTAGLVPSPGDAYGLRAALRVAPALEVGVGMTYVREQRAGDFGFGLTVGEVRACALPWGASSALRLCGAILAGGFSANVRAGERSVVEVGTFPWIGAAVGPGVALRLGDHVAVDLGIDAVVPFSRRQGFVRGASEPVWEQGSVGAQISAGLALAF